MTKNYQYVSPKILTVFFAISLKPLKGTSEPLDYIGCFHNESEKLGWVFYIVKPLDFRFAAPASLINLYKLFFLCYFFI